MHQYRTLVYRSPQGGVLEGSLGQAKYMLICLPLAAHGNPTGIPYTGQRNIFSLLFLFIIFIIYLLFLYIYYFYFLSGHGKSMEFFGRGRNCQQSFADSPQLSPPPSRNALVPSKKNLPILINDY